MMERNHTSDHSHQSIQKFLTLNKTQNFVTVLKTARQYIVSRRV